MSEPQSNPGVSGSCQFHVLWHCTQVLSAGTAFALPCHLVWPLCFAQRTEIVAHLYHVLNTTIYFTPETVSETGPPGETRRENHSCQLWGLCVRNRKRIDNVTVISPFSPAGWWALHRRPLPKPSPAYLNSSGPKLAAWSCTISAFYQPFCCFCSLRSAFQKNFICIVLSPFPISLLLIAVK